MWRGHANKITRFNQKKIQFIHFYMLFLPYRIGFIGYADENSQISCPTQKKREMKEKNP